MRSYHGKVLEEMVFRVNFMETLGDETKFWESTYIPLKLRVINGYLGTSELFFLLLN